MKTDSPSRAQVADALNKTGRLMEASSQRLEIGEILQSDMIGCNSRVLRAVGPVEFFSWLEQTGWPMQPPEYLRHFYEVLPE